MALAILATISQSVIAVSSRAIKSINYAAIMVYQGILQVIVMTCILTAVYVYTNDMPLMYASWNIYGYIVIASIINVAGLALVLIAYQSANPAIVGLFMYIGVAYNFVADKLFFTLDLNNLKILGLSMIMGFVILVAVKKMIVQEVVEEAEKNNEDAYHRSDGENEKDKQDV